MPGDQDKTLGEIGRSVDRVERAIEELRAEVRDRHHKIANDVAVGIGPVSALGVRMNIAERNIEDTMRKVASVEVRSATIAGGIGVVAFLAQFVPGWLKGH